ncbi:hypothetical protein C8R45DRAFT_991379 [Mycena sanguinolenta]|nr:hypothetical protein C8R45DRAFT_991379 [Mycena sanguinolenta]
MLRTSRSLLARAGCGVSLFSLWLYFRFALSCAFLSPRRLDPDAFSFCIRRAEFCKKALDFRVFAAEAQGQRRGVTPMGAVWMALYLLPHASCPVGSVGHRYCAVHFLFLSWVFLVGVSMPLLRGGACTLSRAPFCFSLSLRPLFLFLFPTLLLSVVRKRFLAPFRRPFRRFLSRISRPPSPVRREGFWLPHLRGFVSSSKCAFWHLPFESRDP